MNLGAIQISKNEKDQFISNLFLVKKKNGKFRPVINLRKLNKFVEYFHFKMETLQHVTELLKRDAYFTSIDLENAYFSIPISKNSRKYLKFIWNDVLYEFVCLPFGLSSAPRVFTKIMKPIFSYMRSQGISCFFYIDDSLNQDIDQETCMNNATMLLQMMEELGFYINFEKSALLPSRRILYFGFIIDSEQFKLFLPEEKL